MKQTTLFFCLSIFILSCTHFNKKLSSHISESMEKLKISHDDKSKAHLALGNPSRVFESDIGQTVWIYNDPLNSFQIGTLIFGKNGKLKDMVRYVTSQQPEIRFEVAKARYHNGNFTMEDREWIDPHIAPNERFYIDYNKGICITLGITRNEVESISWFDPNYPPKRPTKNDYVFYQKDNGLVTIRPKKVEKFLEIQVAREIASLEAKTN